MAKGKARWSSLSLRERIVNRRIQMQRQTGNATEETISELRKRTEELMSRNEEIRRERCVYLRKYL